MTQAVVQIRNIVARSGFANPLTLGVLVSDEDYVKVYADTTLLDNGPDYEITGIGDPNGISIEIIGAEDVDNYVGVLTFTALYDPPYDQQSDLSAGGVLGRGFETGLDQQNRRMQALGDRVDRALKVNVNIDGDIILDPVDGQIPMWDEDTQQFVFIESVPSAQAEASAAAAAASAAAAALSATDAETEADAAAASAMAAAASAAAAAIAETAAEQAETNAEAAEVAAEAAQAAAEAAVADALPKAGGTMTGPIGFTHQASPANPSAGVLALFAKTDNKMYTRSPAGVEIALGSGDIIEVATRAALKALDTTVDTLAYLTETGRVGTFVWKTGDYSTHVTADTLEGIYVKATAIASSAGAWVRAEATYLGGVRPEWFGAVANGTTDDAAALQAAVSLVVALNLGGVLLPGATLRVKTTISIAVSNSNNFFLRGVDQYKSVISISDTSNGITYVSSQTTANAHPALTLEGFSIETSKKNGGTAISATWANALNIERPFYMSRVEMRQCITRGSDSGGDYGYWTKGVYLSNARNSAIDHCYFFGEMNLSPNTSIGFQLDNECTFFTFTDVLVLESTTGIYVGGTSEGVKLVQCSIVYCRYGARHDIASGAEPEFVAIGCDFNCANVGIWTTNSQMVQVIGCTFFASAGLDVGTWPDFTGVLIQGAEGRFGTVVGCNFTKESGRTGDVTTGVDFNAGGFYSASANKFYGFSGNLLTYGVQARSGVTDVVVTEDNIFQYVSSQFSSLGTRAGFSRKGDNAFYSTPAATQEGVSPSMMESVQLADFTGSNSSAAQPVFAAAQDTLTLLADTTYEFEAEYFITRAAGSTSHTTGVLFGGTATFDAVGYLAQVTNPTGNVLANVQQIWSAAATEVVLTAANTSTTENLLIKLKGRIRTNAGGTLIPQFKYSVAPGGAPTTKANSAFRIWPIGSDQVAIVGPWA